MQSPYEKRQAMSIHARHFGIASNRARLFYTILLIVCLIVSLTIKQSKAVSPHTKFEEAPSSEERYSERLSLSSVEVTYVELIHPDR